MKPYHNLDSGIEAFDFGNDWMRLQFKGGKVYEYRSPPVALHHIAAMKQLAEAQDDLNTYLNQNRDVHKAGKRV